MYEGEFINLNKLIEKHLNNFLPKITLNEGWLKDRWLKRKKKVSWVKIKDDLEFTQTNFTCKVKNGINGNFGFKDNIVSFTVIMNGEQQSEGERVQESISKVTITRGLNYDNTFNIKIPKISKKKSFISPYLMENKKENVIDKNINRSLSSVPGRSETGVSCTIKEEEYDLDFETEVMLKGSVKFKLMDNKNNVSLGEYTLNDLQQVFTAVEGFVAEGKNSVKFTVRGVVSLVNE